MTSLLAKQVYDIVSTIPAGKVSTYAALARNVGSSPRAVGRVLRNNPHPSVPCHRVICSDGRLSGYFGISDSADKRLLLVSEGVLFISERVSPECIIVFE